ncbi:hypothetical protein BEP19_15810 [Ammoniphilus oxalaticus]|uniref:Uncharacterized protein n=2 Tax=Ammoniphilus oxalaticus TaxID=66863 RepID=A0A419SDI3_9BACL|nr:hypothetical protein BEP19_15810 [Ammoniphilus oxalaticus]
MIVRFLIHILIKLLGDDEEMMALLLAQRVILDKLDFEDVPPVLKPQVYDYLLDSGVEFLAGDYQPPSTE